MAEEAAEQQSREEAAAAVVGLLGFKPHLAVPAMKADAAVQFYKAAFGAEELRRVAHPKRKAEHELPLILFAELKIGSSLLLVSDCFDAEGEGGTAAVIGGGISFRLQAEDVDAAVKMAVAAGAEVVSEVAEDESGVVVKLKDPFGVVWVVSAAVGNKTLDAEAEA
ncbi:hypothetical protein MUK42_01945 [Musa troglodytarum]|uniref:VOC domain-containing protein n=1 Tax=Musa troglodytarum TaxID=320322 RepID=A0A9E7FEJ7_9LILI|nr:hypothetical protein MUK42_01945 [Musa troglodytarum]